MSATGLDVFDKTLQTTNIWLNEIMDRLGPDRHVAWKILSAVLHPLRDRLPVELAAHLGSQLPLLVRGLYYDQFEPARQPSGCDTPEQFRAAVASWLRDIRPVDPDEAIGVVFALLSRHVSEGQVAKVRHSLPRGIRMLWDGADARELAEAGA
jgi:uncharacterized protein (DUF2267 family)